MSSVLEVFRTYDVDLPRVRMGEPHDGGYVFFEGFEYELLLSGGISDTLQFEDEFVETHKLPCIAHDHTISGLPPHRNKELIQFDRRMISDKNSESSTNLTEHLRAHKRTFVKMDIESSEWDWLRSLEERDMWAIDQMVIELHITMGVDDGNKHAFFERMRVLNQLNHTHMLMHAHANNSCISPFQLNNIEYPRVIECTYLHKKLLVDRLVVLNMRVFPTSLDRPNTQEREDIAAQLNKEPFRTNLLCAVKKK